MDPGGYFPTGHGQLWHQASSDLVRRLASLPVTHLLHLAAAADAPELEPLYGGTVVYELEVEKARFWTKR